MKLCCSVMLSTVYLPTRSVAQRKTCITLWHCQLVGNSCLECQGCAPGWSTKMLAASWHILTLSGVQAAGAPQIQPTVYTDMLQWTLRACFSVCVCHTEVTVSADFHLLRTCTSCWECACASIHLAKPPPLCTCASGTSILNAHQ